MPFIPREARVALQNMALSYGAKKIASELDLAPSSLYAMLNPYSDEKAISFERAMYIMGKCNNYEPVSIMLAEKGLCLTSMAAEPDKKTVAKELVDLGIAYGRVCEVCINEKSNSADCMSAFAYLTDATKQAAQKVLDKKAGV